MHCTDDLWVPATPAQLISECDRPKGYHNEAGRSVWQHCYITTIMPAATDRDTRARGLLPSMLWTDQRHKTSECCDPSCPHHGAAGRPHQPASSVHIRAAGGGQQGGRGRHQYCKTTTTHTLHADTTYSTMAATSSVNACSIVLSV